MSLAESRKDRYTYQDLVTWPDNERWELIDGRPYNMTPAPSTRHQWLVGRLFTHLASKLEGRRCVPFIAPTDVVLSEHDVVQPDVLVVCDHDKITPANIRGAPDLVVEISSPSTALKDRREKSALYERHGVKEYILVDPDGRYVERFTLGPDGTFGKGEILGHQDTLRLHCVEGVNIALQEVFREIGRTDAAIDELVLDK